MKQLAQRPRDGRIRVIESPSPELRRGWVLVANRHSLISAGTERAKVELGGQSVLQKARSRPDLARQVVERARVDGVRSTYERVRERLDALAPIGYSAAGVVLGAGYGVEGLAPGERVACGGAGWANHAEVIAVPRRLVAKIPAGVALEAAAYATVGAIALHGVRRAEVGVGERVGVIGLGLVGQLAVRILDAAGCQAFGIDPDPSAVRLAAEGGARAFERNSPTLEAEVRGASGQLGLDSVLVCAASRSSDPIALAARLARDRGRLVVVGDVPVDADRGLLYEKELDLRLSRSYGPGRYDRDYEEYGRDLPAGYVRWTEERNLQAFLELVAAGKLNPTELTTHRFPVYRAEEAYGALSGDDERRPFGILLEYGEKEAEPVHLPPPPRRRTGTGTGIGIGIGLIGAGAFARATLVPAIRKAGAHLVAVASERGLSAADAAERFGFERAASSPEEIFADERIGAVLVATRHSSHAALAAAAMRAGKAVFVEKPLALDRDGLLEVQDALADGGLLMVGFNRRFAPLIERLRRELGGLGGRVLLARVNAGRLPPEHWLHDPREGGGRLLGEGCHFVDLLSELAAGEPISVQGAAVPQAERPLECSDDFSATLRYSNGSVATLVYTGSGDPRLAKERFEAFAGGTSIVLDDFRRLEVFRDGRRTVAKQRQDKGHHPQLVRFLDAVAGKVEPPPVSTYLRSTLATLAVAESIRTGLPVDPSA